MADTASTEDPVPIDGLPSETPPAASTKDESTAAAETPSESKAEASEEQPVAEEATKAEETKKDAETLTDATGESDKADAADGITKNPIVSASKKSRPPYKYDPDKITLRFLFANRDGLTVTIECNPADTVGEVKAALLSVWPTDLPACSGGDVVRMVCMGKGYLMPDSRTLDDCQIPVFKTHPTPVNVSVRPDDATLDEYKLSSKKKKTESGRGAHSGGGASANAAGTAQVDQGCNCTIL